ncbi:transposase family protein [Streptomyces sp. NPDC097981]|uniref:transposase family protein n=1 Tax=Streptomyces sp. NPDC097981 TaxID=3155428 RepID=UPI0033281E03
MDGPGTRVHQPGDAVGPDRARPYLRLLPTSPSCLTPPRPGRRGCDDLGVAGVITASEPSWIAPSTGLSARTFGKLVAVLRREGADAVRKGRPWSLPLEDRAVLVAAYRRTNLTMRQLAPLFGCPSRRRIGSPTIWGRCLGSGPQAVRQGHRADRGRHPGAHPGSHNRRAVQELPVLHQPPGSSSTLAPAWWS